MLFNFFVGTVLEPGTYSAKALFVQEHSSNTAITWAIRAGGLMTMWIGLRLFFNPISAVADVIPILGTVLEWGRGFVAGVATLVLSIATIALTWISVRPLLACTILIAVAVATFWLPKRRAEKADSGKTEALTVEAVS